MANKKGIRVKNEIIRLKNLGHGKKTVARILGVSKNTIRRYWGKEELVLGSPKNFTPNWAKELDWKFLERAISDGQSLSDFYIENLFGKA